MNNTYPVNIHIETEYLEAQSLPQRRRFAFAYTITIENSADQAVQLISRHWIITDANNTVQQAQGTGVIGKQPRIAPGDSFTYTSGAILATDAGTMEGSYTMQTDAGETFTVPIPIFMLHGQYALH